MGSAKCEAKFRKGEISTVYAPFDQALSELRSSGMRYPITARDLADARIQLGSSNLVSRDGSFTREGFAYAKGEPVLLALQSPLLRKQLTEQAVQANRRGNYFLTSNLEVYEKLRAQAEKDKNKSPDKRKVIILPKKTNFDVTKQDDVAKGLLKDQTDDFFDFIKQESVKTYLVSPNTVNSQNGTLLTQLWFGGVCGYRSGFDGNYMGLSYVGRVRGVKSTGGAGSQSAKQKLPYTTKQLDKYARIVQEVRDGSIPASKLEKVVDFLGGLKQ